MQASNTTILRDIVLVGGGHSHVGVLKSFGMRPIPGVRLTLICTDMHTPYSGMLPGYVAGHYDYDQVHIDLSRLAAFSGARLYHDEVLGLDRTGRKVLCRKHPPVPYDVLSINIGSTPQLRGVPGAPEHAIAVKPITRFNQRWLALLDRIQHHPGSTTVAVVGAGAGGVELLLAMQFRLRNELRLLGRNPDELVFHLFTSSPTILPTHNAWVRRHFDKVLAQRQVQVHRNAAVSQVLPGRLQTGDGKWVDADEIVWVTRAGGAAWLQDTGLALDPEGFIQVNDYLQCLNDPNIFAAGDIANMVNYPLEKAGVFAVRQGPPLTENLRLSVTGKALTSYHPQRRWLALISTGDQYAVASRGWLGFAGSLVWRWKDWIDQRFMRNFTELTPMRDDGPGFASEVQLSAEESTQAISALSMRCGGCAAKVGADVLSRALRQLKPVQRDDVIIGLADPDDAAVVRVPTGKAMVHTVDFFRTMVDDPYLFGRIAANHALGDIWAMGAEPQSATAIATVPVGLDSKLEDLLFQMMTGALEVLNEANCALVGGHTGEGKELALGFVINGLIDDDPARILRKSGMRPGDVLILTKPIGTGALFVAHARLAAKGRWIEAALASVQVSNRDGAQILREFGVTACTDLTGFGLIGHLVEMTRPSKVDAEIDLSALPVLAGAQEVMAEGIVSSLHRANLRMNSALRNRAEMELHPRYPLLFDPQTAGGLLASVPAEWAEACIAALRERGYAHAVAIGRVLAQGEALEPIILRA
jgi:selenide, water dikinase